MKIALVCKVYPTQRPGGMGFVCQDRARQLASEGHEVRVLTTGFDGHNGREIVDEGVCVHHMPCKEAHYSDEFASHCFHHVKGFDPDILHLDSFDVRRPWWRDVQRTKTRLAVTFHGFCWGSWLTELNLAYRAGGPIPLFDAKSFAAERHLALDFDSVIGISLHEHWLLVQMMGIPNAHLVYNPIAPYFFEGTSAVSRPSGRRRKYLLAAVSGFNQRGVDVAKAAAEKAGVDLVIAKSTPRPEMPAVIDSCDGLVLPTAYAQGLDLTVGEAFTRQRIVFATRTGSYWRESEEGGAYYDEVKTFPLVDPEQRELVDLMRDFPLFCSAGNRSIHRPEKHTKAWLGAIVR